MRYSDTCSARRWLELWPPDADATHGAVQLGSSTQQGLPCRSLIALSMALGALDPGPPGKAESADAAGALHARVLRSDRSVSHDECAGSRHGPNQLIHRLSLPIHAALSGAMSLGETATIASAYAHTMPLPRMAFGSLRERWCAATSRRAACPFVWS